MYLCSCCARSDEPPDVNSLRCVPAAWCTTPKQPPMKLWDDTGAGGGKPGSIWVVNNMDLMYVVPGYDPPSVSSTCCLCVRIVD
jgi:hypothetical protein